MLPTQIKYVISFIDNKKYCQTNGQFTKHLRSNNLTFQQYYEKFITHIFPKCQCGNSLTFYQNSLTYANSCGNPICVGKIISMVKNNKSKEEKAIEFPH